MDEQVTEFHLEGFGIVAACEVAEFEAPASGRSGDAGDDLPNRVLALGRAERAVEVL